jgi:hypothetical protein
MAPDFEYFLRLTPQDRFGHTLPGLVVFTLPVALAVLWLFHHSVKFAVVRLLPDCVQQRLVCDPGFRFGPARRFALIVLSVFAGALTHIAWDSFTHRESWLVEHSPFLLQTVTISWLPRHPMPLCILLQQISTLGGLAILAIWCIAWFHSTAPAQPVTAPLSRGAKLGAVVLLLVLALCGALLRTALFHSSSHFERLAVFVVAAIALLWWELVALGWCWQPCQAARLNFSQL